MATSQAATSGCGGIRSTSQFALRLQPVIEVVSVCAASRAVRLERARAMSRSVTSSDGFAAGEGTSTVGIGTTLAAMPFGNSQSTSHTS